MLLHFTKIIAISAIILFFIFLPFFPGRYDSTAVTLSFMAQLLGMSGLLLVPAGLLLLISKKKPLYLTRAALVLCCLIALVVSLSPWLEGGISLALIAAAFFSYILVKAFRNAGQLKHLGLYFIFIPVIVTGLRFLFIVPATNFSRAYAIEQSQPMIRAIETFYQQHGHYPYSLHAVNKDYDPGVVGIKEYHYEPFGQAYNLFFEQFTYVLDTEEVVMYNKLDEHAMTSHDMDLLEFTGAQLALRRGDRHRYDLAQAHWKYFWFE